MKKRFYVLTLCTFLCAMLFAACGTEKNLIEGHWLGNRTDVGYFEFTQDSFRWYKTQDDLEDNYYYGTYTLEPYEDSSTSVEQGYEMYTITMVYEGAFINGAEQEISPGGYFLVQLQGGPDYLAVYNSRTGGEFYITRVD
ncbi:hypothetical protein LJB77_00230 [Ruminococcaceae bacterium OttesenSCG-928-N02]|nr:hypothetical protein [Ruminococcaceae bacterium OttesenSCG-928-N02]